MAAWLRHGIAATAVLAVVAACGGSAFTSSGSGGGGGGGGAGGGGGSAGGSGSGGGGGGDVDAGGGGSLDGSVTAVDACAPDGKDPCCCAAFHPVGHVDLYSRVWQCSCTLALAACTSECGSTNCTTPPQESKLCTACLVQQAKQAPCNSSADCAADCQNFVDCYSSCH